MKIHLLAIVLMLSIPATAQKNWELSNQGISATFFGYGMVASGDTLYVSGTDEIGITGKRSVAVYKSTNNGSNWQIVPIATSFPNSTMLRVLYHGGNFMLATQYTGNNFEKSGLRVSYNGGISWESSHQGIDSTNETIISVVKLDNGTLLADGWHIINGHILYTSADDGKNWTKHPSFSGIRIDHSFTLYQTLGRLYAVSYDFQTKKPWIYTSDDNGFNWKKKNLIGIAPSAEIKYLITADNKNITLVSEAQKEIMIYTSTDSGNVWTPDTPNVQLPSPTSSYAGIRAALYNNNIFYAILPVAINGYQNQVFRSNPAAVSIPNIQKQALKVYPNPTSNVLTINGFVYENSIEVFSLTGQKLQTVQNGNTVDVSALERGIYVLKATDNDNTHTMRFVKE